MAETSAEHHAQTAHPIDTKLGSFKALPWPTSAKKAFFVFGPPHTCDRPGLLSARGDYLQIQENIGLFCQTRDNILSILNELNNMPGVMKHMPPLPVKLNEELANSILPRLPMPMQS